MELGPFGGKYALQHTENFDKFIAELQLPAPAAAAAADAANAPKGFLEIVVHGNQLTITPAIPTIATKPYTLVVGSDPVEIVFMGLVKAMAKTSYVPGKISADLAPPHVGGPPNAKPIHLTLEKPPVGPELTMTVTVGPVVFKQLFKKM